jgi:hypothetical protein
MERGALFYILLGAGTVIVPTITDRLLKGRVANRRRIALDILAAALTGGILALIARPLGL